MKISVNCPSYKRGDDVKTLSYLPFCRVWVDCGEYDEYKRNYPEADIISCPEGVQGNLCRIRNYILDEEFKRGMDVVLIIDDDFTCLRRFDYVASENWGYEPYIITADEFLTVIEKYSIIASDMGAKFWGVNCNCDPMAYRHNTPFSTRSYIGGPFQCFLKGNRCRYDENLPLKEDYDMTIQQLNMERVVLRVNAYHYLCKQSEQKGGCATYRNRQREEEQLEALRRKWGGQIVKIDTSNKGQTTKEKRLDYNPIIRIPIKGV
jgi:hypothetical protein